MRLMNSDASSPAMSEIASPWKIGSNRMTDPPTTTARAVRSMGRNRTAPASMTASPSGMLGDGSREVLAQRIDPHRHALSLRESPGLGFGEGGFEPQRAGI